MLYVTILSQTYKKQLTGQTIYLWKGSAWFDAPEQTMDTQSVKTVSDQVWIIMEAKIMLTVIMWF